MLTFWLKPVLPCGYKFPSLSTGTEVPRMKLLHCYMLQLRVGSAIPFPSQKWILLSPNNLVLHVLPHLNDSIEGGCSFQRHICHLLIKCATTPVQSLHASSCICLLSCSLTCFCQFTCHLTCMALHTMLTSKRPHLLVGGCLLVASTLKLAFADIDTSAGTIHHLT